MELKEERFCPLGKECVSVGKKSIKRCMWHIKVIGKNPQTNKEVDEWGCAIAWQPTLTMDNTRVNRGVAAGIESLRNVTDTNQKIAIQEIGKLDGSVIQNS